ncbi:MAG: adenosine deaminase, partial [Anaerotignaceae bacterium]
MNIPKFPLIDLHIHLDGSLSPNSVIEMAKNDNISLPTYNEEELKTLLSAPLNCTDLNQYLQCFYIPTQVLQTKDNISFAVKSLIERLNEEGLVYAEIRFAPQKHLEKGLTQEEVIQSAINGMNTALNKYPIKAQLILCAMRGDNNYQENMETIRLAEKYLGKGVAACDLA